ncbi:spermidine synthase [Subtercola endophyticus]|uniref:spermidine synthase n=1 Tax=Subtercola endophyticus TaxID=2895559 RepID=UPI001E65540A|nr:fused MFS/spermidine synthase [Subtercola endophyticus]UFS61247.1 fused MFS/spermidine synthase [Subtercola endophyticus]
MEADRHQPGAFTLVVDGTPQSHVSLESPEYLSFEYVRRIGHGIDLVAPEREPITAVHLGGGAFTLPRYIAATRPGSRQQVVELETDLVDFVREHLPLPKDAQVRIRHGDARAVLAKLPLGLKGTVDVVVVDVFSGARTPAHVTSMEFYTQLAALLKPTGILAANVADGAGLAFARRQAATLSAVFGNVALVVDPQVLKSRRFGNVVMFASDDLLPFDRLPRLVASDPVPAKVVAGAELAEFIADAPVVTDQTAVPSPPPARSIFQVKPGADR